MNRDEAQARLNRIEAFASELAALQRDGALSLDEAQVQAIAEHHRRLTADLAARFDVDRGAGQRQMTLGMRIASLLGAIALCAAAYLFFYRIWGWITIPVQVSILVAAPLVGIALTETAHRFDRSRHFVFIAGLIACASLVLNVTMIGRIFAMTDSPNALAVWAIFALIVGHGYGLRLATAVGLVLAMVFVAGFALALRGFDWTFAAQRPELFLPLSTIVLAVGTFGRFGQTHEFAPTHRIVGLSGLLIALWSLSLSETLSVLPWGETFVRAFYQVLGFAASTVALAAGLKRNWVETTNIGAGMFVVFLYTKFYQWWWDWMPAYLFFLLVGLVALAVIVVLRRLRGGAVTRSHG